MLEKMDKILRRLWKRHIIPSTKRLLWLSLKVIVINTVFILLLHIFEQMWIIENAWLSVQDLKWHLDRRGVRYDDNSNRYKLLEQLETSGDSLKLTNEKSVHCESSEDCQNYFIHDWKRVWLIKVGKRGCLTDAEPKSLNSWDNIVGEARRIGLKTATLDCSTTNNEGLCWFIRNAKPEYCSLLITSGKKTHTYSGRFDKKKKVYQWIYSSISQMDLVDINKHITTSEKYTYTVTMFAKARLPPLSYRLLSIAFEDKIRLIYFNTNTENGKKYRKSYTTSEFDPQYFVHTSLGNYSYGHGLGEHTTFEALYFFLGVAPTVQKENLYWYILGICNVVGLTLFFVHKEGRSLSKIVLFIIGSTSLCSGIVCAYTNTFGQTRLDIWVSWYVTSSLIGTLSRYVLFRYVSYNMFTFWGIYMAYLFATREIITNYSPELMIDLPFLRSAKKPQKEMHKQKRQKNAVPKGMIGMYRTKNGVQIDTGYVPKRVVSPTGPEVNERPSYTEEEREILLLHLMNLLQSLRNEPRIDVDEVMSYLEKWYHPYDSSTPLDYLHHCHHLFLDSTYCTICAAKYEEGELISGLNCGHTFHMECIYEWFQQNRDTCPNCRKQQG